MGEINLDNNVRRRMNGQVRVTGVIYTPDALNIET